MVTSIAVDVQVNEWCRDKTASREEEQNKKRNVQLKATSQTKRSALRCMQMPSFLVLAGCAHSSPPLLVNEDEMCKFYFVFFLRLKVCEADKDGQCRATLTRLTLTVATAARLRYGAEMCEKQWDATCVLFQDKNVNLKVFIIIPAFKGSAYEKCVCSWQKQTTDFIISGLTVLLHAVIHICSSLLSCRRPLPSRL